VRVAFGERFDIRPGYLNTASIGVPSVNAVDTLAETVAETVAQWRTGSAQPADFDAHVDTRPQRVGAPVGVAPADVAVTLPWLADLDMSQMRAHCVGLTDATPAQLGLPARGPYSLVVSLVQHDGGRGSRRWRGDVTYSSSVPVG
jgi:kynureninase